MGLAIYLLGAPRVKLDGRVLPAPRGHKVWGLLAYLLHSDAGANREIARVGPQHSCSPVTSTIHPYAHSSAVESR